MAIIGKIREKSWLLVGFVGLALVIFILSDLTKCSGPTSGNIGTIDGEKVDEKAYQENLLRFKQDAMMQAQQEQREFTESDDAASVERAWSATVDKIILDKEFEALGIDVSDAEFNSYLYGEEGFPLMDDIAKGFTDSVTGKFNPNSLTRFIEERESSKDANTLKQWEDTKIALRERREQEKYFQLLGQGVYVTKLQAREEYKAQNEKKAISFVVRSFRDIPDTDIKVTDKDIKAFYDEHKNEKKYEMLAGRDVKYFDVTLQPSRKDSSEFSKRLTLLKTNFAASINDSAFVNDNTEAQQRFPKVANPYRKAGDPNAKSPLLTYPEYMDTIFRAASIGQIVGPYNNEGKTYLAKVKGFDTQSLSARHILLPAQKTDVAGSAAQKKMADSLTAILNADKTRFEEFVNTYSSDGGSKEKGGKYDDFTRDEFVPEFSDFVIANPVGKIGVVQSEFGFHIIEVLGKKDARVPLLAVIERTLAPSSETEAELKDKAYDLLYEFDTKLAKTTDIVAKLNLFDTLATKEGYVARSIRMLEEAPKVTPAFNTKIAENKIIQLAFDNDATVGTLCSSPISDKGRYVIAIVSSIRKEKGAPELADVYRQMRDETIKAKKAEKIIKQIGKNQNLEVIAKKGNTDVKTAEVIFANPSIQGGGYEPEVIGSLFSGVKDGKTTLPLTGNAGVYVIRVNKTIKAPATTTYETERKQMVSQARGSVAQDAMGALRKKANVYDNRVLTELGIFR